MKQLLKLLALCVSIGISFSCAKINDLTERVDRLESASIASVESQINNVKASVGDLEKASSTLNEHIAALKKEQQTLSDNTSAEFTSLEKRIETLEEIAENLQESINGLKEYVDNGLTANRDWAKTTFATLEQYETIQTQLSEIKLSVSGLETKLLKAIQDSETTMKKWVNNQLSGYYTISEVNAKLKALQTALEDGDDAVRGEVEKLRGEFETTKTQIKAAYEKAIKEAIEKYDGEISAKIAEDIKKVNDDLQGQINNVSERIDGIETRVKALEDELTALINSIQSVVVIPDYNDGSVGVFGTSKIDFEIFPLTAAEKLAEADVSILSLKAVYTQTKAESRLVDIPVLSHSYEDGIYSIVIKGDTLSEAFYLGEISASARLHISDGKANLSTAYFPLTYESDGSTIFSFSLSDGNNTESALGICGDVITVCMPYGTDLSNLVASFTTDAYSLSINGVPQKSGKNSNNFSKPVTYTASPKNGPSRNYTVNVFTFDLPVMYIETPDQVAIKSKDEWIKDGVVRIHTADGKIDDLGGTSVKGRGNSTWTYPKKPYTLKLDSKSKVLGMPKDKRWNLLANWRDRTNIRNAVAFELSKKTKSLEWTSRGEFVELIINGKHNGLYYLCEHIKVSKDRVNIAEISPKSISGDALTGGYLLEFDANYDEAYKFKTAIRNLPVNLKAPDEDVPDEQLAYIKGYVNNVESLLYESNPATSAYKDFIDIDTYIDWWFVHEMTMNSEPNTPKSCYMFKDANGKLKAGPCWDFDYATFKPSTAFRIKDALWYTKLFEDPAFIARVKEKWAESVDDFRSVVDEVDSFGQKLENADVANAAMWPIDVTNKVNGDEDLSFDAAVTKLKNTLSARIEWLGKAIEAL